MTLPTGNVFPHTFWDNYGCFMQSRSKVSVHSERTCTSWRSLLPMILQLSCLCDVVTKTFIHSASVINFFLVFWKCELFKGLTFSPPNIFLLIVAKQSAPNSKLEFSSRRFFPLSIVISRTFSKAWLYFVWSKGLPSNMAVSQLMLHFIIHNWLILDYTLFFKWTKLNLK